MVLASNTIEIDPETLETFFYLLALRFCIHDVITNLMRIQNLIDQFPVDEITNNRYLDPCASDVYTGNLWLAL